MSFSRWLAENAHLLIWDSGRHKRIDLREGDVFRLAPHVLHSPQQPEADSRRLVIERQRPLGQLDAFQWGCANCGAVVPRSGLQLQNIVTDLATAFKTLHASSNEARRCSRCGQVHEGKCMRARITPRGTTRWWARACWTDS